MSLLVQAWRSFSRSSSSSPHPVTATSTIFITIFSSSNPPLQTQNPANKRGPQCYFLSATVIPHHRPTACAGTSLSAQISDTMHPCHKQQRGVEPPPTPCGTFSAFRQPRSASRRVVADREDTRGQLIWGLEHNTIRR